ncbi:hypothetical protein ABT390_34120 [Streptomyces aurantiacus]|uniref:Uncharacterized protein n=1 Tax=Streptomyces aurantiacus JA 4570 TaxID=1286094 RepID=S3ZEG6_9ACTN|nr:hypothetical protein [Streptomyces aurantiacus]EPH41029.1 hypothetical protein STRAU_5907 [Streptomyces aurantiacus JA 4570]
MDELMRRRVYGSDHDDPDPGPQPGRPYRELVGGPLDGLLVDVTGLSDEQLAEGALLITEIGAYGPGGCAEYGPREDMPSVWDWRGDTP